MFYQVTRPGSAGTLVLNEAFDTFDAAGEAAGKAGIEHGGTWELRETPAYTDRTEPPTCWHQAGQGLVNALWCEAQYWRKKAEAAGGDLEDEKAESYESGRNDAIQKMVDALEAQGVRLSDF